MAKREKEKIPYDQQATVAENTRLRNLCKEVIQELDRVEKRLGLRVPVNGSAQGYRARLKETA